MKFDCLRLRLMVLMESVRYITTPTNTKVRDVVPTDSSAQYRPARCSDSSAPKTASRIQPTIRATSSTIITTPSVIGNRSERRSNMSGRGGWVAHPRLGVDVQTTIYGGPASIFCHAADPDNFSSAGLLLDRQAGSFGNPVEGGPSRD